MAINYLNSIDLNQNELIKARIENQPNNASAGTGVEGQLYYDTTLDVVKVWAGGSWVEVGGGVETLTTTDGTYIDLTPNSATSGAVTVTADLSAVDGTAVAGTRFLSKDNTWDVVAFPTSDNYGSWTLDADGNGATASITSGATADFVGGLKITTDSTAAGVLNIVHDLQSQTDTTSTGSPAYGGNFTTVDSVTRDTTGHVTGINVKTVTLPASIDNYVDSISFNIANGELTLGRTGALADLTEDLDGRYLELAGGTMTGEINMGSDKITNLLDPTNAQDAATKQYVDDSVAGGLIYQGGFDGSTGYVDGTADYLDNRGTQIAVNQGWTYTVTVAGTFYGEKVEVGDVLIAEDNLLSGTGTLNDWTTVQNNIDLANLTQVGIGNVNAGTGISVTYSSGTATVANTDTNSSNTDSGQITAGQTSGTVNHGFSTTNVIVQTYLDNATENYPTVFCDITRSTSSVTATVVNAQTDDIIILVQKIG